MYLVPNTYEDEEELVEERKRRHEEQIKEI